MWRPPEDIDADLASGDRSRVSAGLRDLFDAMEAMDEHPRPPLEASTLDGAAEEDDVLRLIELLLRYGSFDPPIDDAERRARALDVALRAGTHRVMMELSLVAKGAAEPAAAAAGLLDAVGRRALAVDQVQRASWLVDNLLAGRPPVRAATLRALGAWPRGGTHAAVIDDVGPGLSDEERAAIGR